MRKQADNLKNMNKKLDAHEKAFFKYAKMNRPRMMIVELSFLYEYRFRYGEPHAFKNWLSGEDLNFTVKNLIQNCFDRAESIETEDILFFENPFSQILTANFPENNRQFENALECYNDTEFIKRLKAARKQRDMYKNWMKKANIENEKL